MSDEQQNMPSDTESAKHDVPSEATIAALTAAEDAEIRHYQSMIEQYEEQLHRALAGRKDLLLQIERVRARAADRKPAEDGPSTAELLAEFQASQ